MWESLKCFKVWGKSRTWEMPWLRILGIKSCYSQMNMILLLWSWWCDQTFILTNVCPCVPMLRTSSLFLLVCTWCLVQLLLGLESHHFLFTLEIFLLNSALKCLCVLQLWHLCIVSLVCPLALVMSVMSWAPAQRIGICMRRRVRFCRSEYAPCLCFPDDPLPKKKVLKISQPSSFRCRIVPLKAVLM